MSYQAEREQFIYRVTREGLPLQAAHSLLRQATTINRLAELACSSEAADRDRIPCPAATQVVRHFGGKDRTLLRRPTGPCLCDYVNTVDALQGTHETIPRIRLQDYQAEQRAIKAVPDGWTVLTEGDPRGYTLKVIPPSYAERNKGKDRFNLDSIGVPPGPSRIRW